LIPSQRSPHDLRAFTERDTDDLDEESPDH